MVRNSRLQLLCVAARLLGRADVGVGDDLHERRPGTVEVDEADLVARGIGRVNELRRVFLEVRPRDADGERTLGRLDGQAAGRREGQVVLADLVALGQVGIEVVLAVPAGGVRRGRFDREARREDVLDGAAIDDR